MSDDTLRQTLTNETALMRREIEEKRAAVATKQDHIEELQQSLERMENLYDSLQESVENNEARLLDAQKAIRAVERARSIQEKIRLDPRTPPQKFREDLSVIHAVSARNIQKIEPLIRHKKAKLMDLDKRISRARELAETFLEQTTEEQEWLEFAEPLVTRLQELTEEAKPE